MKRGLRLLGGRVLSTTECPLACTSVLGIHPHPHLHPRGWRGTGETLGTGAQEGPIEGKWAAWSHMGD